MTERKAGKLGMKNFRRNDVKLKFRTYLNTAALPNVPARFGHVSNTPPGGYATWGMLGNDKYGCCVLAGAAHEQMLWQAATHRNIPEFTAQNIVGQYLRLTDGEDNGLDPVTVANYRRTVGISDSNGTNYRIKAYALVDSLHELEYAVYLFGAVGIGFFLPPSAQPQFMAHHMWDDVGHSPDPNAGHYVPIVGRMGGHWVAITWGELQGITDDYMQKYSFDAGGGGIAYFSRSYLLDSGKSPEAIDEAALDEDLKAIPGISDVESA